MLIETLSKEICLDMLRNYGLGSVESQRRRFGIHTVRCQHYYKNIEFSPQTFIFEKISQSLLLMNSLKKEIRRYLSR